MRDRFAYIISLVFHPLLMPSYLFLFIILFASSMMQPLQKESLLQVLSIIFIVTFIIPVISIGTLRLSNFITDLNLVDKKQRITPFLFVTCFYGISAYLFYAKLSINNMIFLVFSTTAVLLFILTIVTIFWKISAHGAGIGGTIGFILALGMAYPIHHFAIVLAILLIIAGLIVHSRLSLNTHSPLQVYAGVLLGAVFCFCSFIFFL
ncbi:MAG: PA-phosphatase [Cyclobacteriaceae bacterium]|nr:PA-phosphatase [Cyclobacteriaceae bacterium]MCK5368294.1 PA-phosphatase [Cyclobacteriaceae bacterium]MCK5471115.1 PA-phosphatase [Cyclobacteriaceae bacterium]